MFLQESRSESRARPGDTEVPWSGAPTTGVGLTEGGEEGEPVGSRSGTAGSIGSRVGWWATGILSMGCGLAAWLGFGAVGTFQDSRQAVQEWIGAEAPLGLALRAGVERLDARLLRYPLTGDVADREVFSEESRVWSGRLSDARAEAGGERPRGEVLRRVAEAFEGYRAAGGEWLSRERPSLRRATPGLIAAEVDALSRSLREACDGLVAAEAASRTKENRRLRGFFDTVPRRVVGVAVVWVVTVAGVAVVMWRGVVVPLRGALEDARASRQRRDRLAEFGTVAAGVVHEIRTPLTAIRTRAHQLRRSRPDCEGELGVIEDEVRRLDRILEDFLQFARPAEPRKEVLEVGAVLRGLQDLVGRTLAERGIRVVVEAPNGLVVHADPAQLRQVLLNLVRNAADSVSEGGSVTLRARSGMEARRRPAVPVVMIEVTDTGGGIPPEVEGRLFEPFVSAKSRGIGLGLSIAARLVEGQGGHIQYQTQPGRGTVFTVVLPRTGDPVLEVSA